jgi:hypothetical protein
MAKKIDPKAKAKRQKIIAAVGGVLLLGLLAFQVPRTMKMLNQHGVDSGATTTTASAPAGATGGAGTTSLGATPVSASPSGDSLSDPDTVPTPQSGQLLAFSRFRTKDPFSQQLDLSCAGASASSPSEGAASAACDGSSSGSASGTGSGTGASPPKEPAKPPPSQGVVSGPVTQKPPVTPPAKPTSATISVNGASESVQVGAQFPASNPTFLLVSLTATAAKIGIAGGSFESGGATVTLKKNKPLTLMNTADGTRYVIRLLSAS